MLATCGMHVEYMHTCRDVNADDYIGTFYLRMSQISSLADNNGMLYTLLHTHTCIILCVHTLSFVCTDCKVFYRHLVPALSTVMVHHESSVSYRTSMSTSTRDW